jgi:prepilin-type N-terminal cleavage/methylation domain-containing protein
MKEEGFTLIEVLAVLILLTILAVITVPIILGIIDDSKMNAFKASSYGIIQSAKNIYIETLYAGDTPENIVFTYTAGVESSEPTGKKLNYDGGNPTSGQVSLTNGGQIAIAIYEGGWCASKDFGVAEVTMEKKASAECILP